jgi:hypothetical protein
MILASLLKRSRFLEGILFEILVKIGKFGFYFGWSIEVALSHEFLTSFCSTLIMILGEKGRTGFDSTLALGNNNGMLLG